MFHSSSLYDVNSIDPSSTTGRNKTTIAAVFDYDKTLYSKDATEVEGFEIILQKYVSWYILWKALVLLFQKLLMDLHLLTTKQFSETYFSCYRNIRLSTLQRHAAEDLYPNHFRPASYKEMISQLNWHRSQGHLIVVISASPEHLVRPFCEDHQVDLWTASILEVVDPTKSGGTCTGRLIGNMCCGDEKRIRLERLANEHNIDLSKSFAYSDHCSDLPLLQAVGNPTAVHPTSRLEQRAKSLHWPIRRPLEILATSNKSD